MLCHQLGLDSFVDETTNERIGGGGGAGWGGGDLRGDWSAGGHSQSWSQLMRGG